MEKIEEQIRTVPKKTFRQRFLTFENVLISLIIAFSVLTFLSKTHPYFFFDLIITKSIQQIHFSWFDSLMRAISFLGNYWPAGLSIGFAVLVFVILKKYKNALFILISTLGVGLLSEALKTLIGRPRPDPQLITQIGKFIRSDSFPSGHVLFYMGFYGFLLFLIFSKLKKGLVRTVLISALLLMILLIGMSRIYLGAHWFSDVLGAYLIGTVWIFVVVLLYRKFLNAPNN